MGNRASRRRPDVTVIDIDPIITNDIPTIYVACPLTCLTDNASRRRHVNSDVTTAKRAIDAVTIGDRLDQQSWPVAVYAPIDHSAPWKTDGLTPQEVYRKNLDAIHASDALIAFGEKGASAGVGQELEWAIRLGIPILYLTADRSVSR